MNHLINGMDERVVEVHNAAAASQIVIVCEHASPSIPMAFHNLGLAPEVLGSHIAWDPGARPVARTMAARLDAVLIAAKVSRLVYDCNRPPEARDAMPDRSEVFDVPGNANLSASEKAARVAQYYTPFRDAVAQVMARKAAPILITMHSFTPIYHNAPRAVEIGVLHDKDARLADALLARSERYLDHDVQRNEPYGPQDGVTHTLKEHAIGQGHLNVMLEVRNDLIADEATQGKMADNLARWIKDALRGIEGQGC